MTDNGLAVIIVERVLCFVFYVVSRVLREIVIRLLLAHASHESVCRLQQTKPVYV